MVACCLRKGWPTRRDTHFPLCFLGSSGNSSSSSDDSSIVFRASSPPITPVTSATLQLITQVTNYISIVFYITGVEVLLVGSVWL